MCKKVTFSVLVSASLDVYIESHHITIDRKKFRHPFFSVIDRSPRRWPPAGPKTIGFSTARGALEPFRSLAGVKRACFGRDRTEPELARRSVAIFFSRSIEKNFAIPFFP
jgi:hypothetical protein